MTTKELKQNGFSKIVEFEKSKQHQNPSNELTDIRTIAPKFRDKFIAGGQVKCVRQLTCSMAPYPTKYGFHSAYEGLNPFMYFNNRATLVQYELNGELKNFLFNPYFPEYSENSGFYSHIKDTYGKYIPQSLFVKRYKGIVEQLEKIGVKAEDIDYVSYDHLHVQDLRPLMGTIDSKGNMTSEATFPNAKFVFHEAEWDSINHIHPLNEIWYVKGGFEKLDISKLLLYNGDLMIADGVALIHTKGHTAGNHSLYLNTEEGTFTISENGVGPDAFNPEKSKINSIRRTAKWKGWEVIMNANTQDYAYYQYNSMIKEKLLSGDSPMYNGYCNHRSSSEFTSWPAAIGLKPTIELGAVNVGEIRQK